MCEGGGDAGLPGVENVDGAQLEIATQSDYAPKMRVLLAHLGLGGGDDPRAPDA